MWTVTWSDDEHENQQAHFQSKEDALKWVKNQVIQDRYNPTGFDYDDPVQELEEDVVKTERYAEITPRYRYGYNIFNNDTQLNQTLNAEKATLAWCSVNDLKNIIENCLGHEKSFVAFATDRRILGYVNSVKFGNELKNGVKYCKLTLSNYKNGMRSSSYSTNFGEPLTVEQFHDKISSVTSDEVVLVESKDFTQIGAKLNNVVLTPIVRVDISNRDGVFLRADNPMFSVSSTSAMDKYGDLLAAMKNRNMQESDTPDNSTGYALGYEQDGKHYFVSMSPNVPFVSEFPYSLQDEPYQQDVIEMFRKPSMGKLDLHNFKVSYNVNAAQNYFQYGREPEYTILNEDYLLPKNKVLPEMSETEQDELRLEFPDDGALDVFLDAALNHINGIDYDMSKQVSDDGEKIVVFNGPEKSLKQLFAEYMDADSFERLSAQDQAEYQKKVNKNN